MNRDFKRIIPFLNDFKQQLMNEGFLIYKNGVYELTPFYHYAYWYLHNLFNEDKYSFLEYVFSEEHINEFGYDCSGIVFKTEEELLKFLLERIYDAITYIHFMN